MSKTIQCEEVGETTEKAFVMINCDGDCEVNVLDQLRSIREIREVYTTIARRSILVMVETNSLEGLRDVIVEKIGKVSQICSTTTFIPIE